MLSRTAGALLFQGAVLSLVLSLGGLAGPVKAARSCVRVFVWVIRSPGTLRVFVPHPSSEPALLTGDFDFGVALRFFGLGFVN